MTTTTRRLAGRAALWSAPAVLMAAAAPARAASPTLEGNLQVTVTDPPLDWATLEYQLDSTIWKNYAFVNQMAQPDPARLTTWPPERRPCRPRSR
ncbi:hypothetical protein BJF82_03205 [Kytococcus sp. CUA-901]|nr:hypothetical protein BJF82_03205 [Kytococcus sp. CUA-901]